MTPTTKRQSYFPQNCYVNGLVRIHAIARAAGAPCLVTHRRTMQDAADYVEYLSKWHTSQYSGIIVQHSEDRCDLYCGTTGKLLVRGTKLEAPEALSENAKEDKLAFLCAEARKHIEHAQPIIAHSWDRRMSAVDRANLLYMHENLTRLCWETGQNVLLLESVGKRRGLSLFLDVENCSEEARDLWLDNRHALMTGKVICSKTYVEVLTSVIAGPKFAEMVSTISNDLSRTGDSCALTASLRLHALDQPGKLEIARFVATNMSEMYKSRSMGKPEHTHPEFLFSTEGKRQLHGLLRRLDRLSKVEQVAQGDYAQLSL